MRLNNIFSVINTCKMCIIPFTFSQRYPQCVKNYVKRAIIYNRCLSTSALNLRFRKDETGSDDDIDVFSLEKYSTTGRTEEYARDLLYKNSKDFLLDRIYCCASVEELFMVFEKNLNRYKSEHILQTIFVLNDLLKIYGEYSAANMKKPANASEVFFKKLQGDDSFQKLLALTESKVLSFNMSTLSYCALYLSKLGLSLETNTMQLLCGKLKKELLNNFSISPASRFLETICREYSLRYYFMSQDLVPFILKEVGEEEKILINVLLKTSILDTCGSAESLSSLSVCLNKLHNVVTDKQLDKYKGKVENLINSGFLKSSDYKVVLQVLAFLNYPKWREKNTVLVSKCIMLINNNLNDLNVNEILLVYEIFYNMQEPASILNNLQRCCYKHFYELEDLPTKEKITLFFSIFFFTFRERQNEFQSKIHKYVKDCHDYDSFILLGKLLAFTKVSDIKLCQLYWNKALNFLKSENQTKDIIKLSQTYINFTTDVPNYRHLDFENAMLSSLNEISGETNYKFFPQKLTNILNFVLLYGEDGPFLEYLVSNVEENWEQLKPLNCLKLSYTLKLFYEMDKKYVKLFYARRIDSVLDKFINKEALNTEDPWKNNALLKSCIYRNKMDISIMSKLLDNCKNFDNISSKNIGNVYYCFLMTNSLIPEVIENIVEYILVYKNHVLGFNVGRVIYLCYCLGYHPKKLTEFCETAVDVIIRDQKRLTGLSIIYSALSLCFFNKLPNSLIKSIFNVEFMEKLDDELKQCYAKDKYPQRVRNHLMQLNRAVCLNYPESNVPWFHQKYIEENVRANHKPGLFTSKVKECLTRIVQNENALLENVITPYGYQIHFVIKLDSQDEIARNESQCTTNMALLLIPEFSYTGKTSQLKGSFQMKRRHLEILGYKVIHIKFSEWISLFFIEDKIEFLKRLIWPKKFSENTQSFR